MSRPPPPRLRSNRQEHGGKVQDWDAELDGYVLKSGGATRSPVQRQRGGRGGTLNRPRSPPSHPGSGISPDNSPRLYGESHALQKRLSVNSQDSHRSSSISRGKSTAGYPSQQVAYNETFSITEALASTEHIVEQNPYSEADYYDVMQPGVMQQLNLPQKIAGQIDNALQRFNKMETEASEMLQFNELDATVKDNIERIIETIRDSKKILERDLERDDREDIPALLDWEKLEWQMSSLSERVRAYRARACKFNHDEFLFRNWHMPMYYSTSPLPSELAVVNCFVTLPQSTQDGRTLVSLQIANNDTADRLKAQVARKIQTSESEFRGMVFKAIGTNEYMDGNTLLWEYDYIRLNIRHDRKIQLALVPRPQRQENFPSQKQQYQTLVAVEDLQRTLLVNDFPAYDIPSRPWFEMDYIPISELKKAYRIRICGIDNLHVKSIPNYDGPSSQIFVRTFLYYGLERIPGTTWTTSLAQASFSARWMQWLSSGQIMISDLPRATRVTFLLFSNNTGDEKDKLLAWVNMNLIDECGQLAYGLRTLKMWPATEAQQNVTEDHTWLLRSTVVPNESRGKEGAYNSATLSVQFDEFALPVIAPWRLTYREPDVLKVGKQVPWKTISNKDRAKLQQICLKDPLYRLTKEDKYMLWEFRHHLVSDPSHLTKVLQSVNWMSPDCVHEAHRLLRQWEAPKEPVMALELLDVQYHDYEVRNYAVDCLRLIPDSELQLFLLQLTQVIKFEPYHDSPLCRFLIARALQSPFVIGHAMFWHLKAEVPQAANTERFAMIMEEYLFHVGRHVIELRKQNSCVVKLQRVAEAVVYAKTRLKTEEQSIEDTYKSDLKRLNVSFFEKLIDGQLQMVLDPRIECTTLKVEKCRYMSSKKVPLWLVFRNGDTAGEDNLVIFKSGDDLRQDILTLQLLKIMDKIWLSEDLDLKMMPYNCIATGVNAENEGVGMIEIVKNSDTTSHIQLSTGGGAMGALKATPLDQYLHDHNVSEAAYERAQGNFVASCAGYCVATFLLGIGDRHNGNIMLQRDGHLFHIDFGHFLGNFKSKMGFKRERCPFVFTPEMAYVMGGKKYKRHPMFAKFKKLCTCAFNAIRKHGSMFITLFVLMIGAEMPELLCAEDVNYLKNMLHLDKTDKEAEEIFLKEIKGSLRNVTRQLDNYIHNLVHG